MRNDGVLLKFGSTEVTFDPAEDEINRKNHDCSLESAVDILTYELVPGDKRPPVVIEKEEMAGEEKRQHILAKDDSGNTLCIVTAQRGEDTVRVVSCRRADKEESQRYTKIVNEYAGSFQK